MPKLVLDTQTLTLNVAIFVSMLGFSIITPILPLYAREVGASSLMVGFLIGAFSLARALVVSHVGILSDRLGRKRFLLAGLLGFSIVSFGMIWASTPETLLLARIGQGIFSAMVLPIAMAIIADLAPSGFEGRSFAGFNISFLLGLGLGPMVGGFIFEAWGMNSNFYCMSLICLLSFFMVLILIKPSKSAVTDSTPTKLSSDLHLLKDRTLQGVFINRIANNMGTGIYIAFLPMLCADKGISPAGVGVLFAINTIIMMVVQKPAARLTDTKYRVQLAGFSSIAAGLCKIVLPLADSFTAFLIIVTIEGVMAGAAMPSTNALAVSAGRRLKVGMGAVMGFSSMAISIGFFIGPVGGGWLADLISVPTAFWLIGSLVTIGAASPLFMQSKK